MRPAFMMSQVTVAYILQLLKESAANNATLNGCKESYFTNAAASSPASMPDVKPKPRVAPAISTYVSP